MKLLLVFLWLKQRSNGGLIYLVALCRMAFLCVYSLLKLPWMVSCLVSFIDLLSFSTTVGEGHVSCLKYWSEIVAFAVLISFVVLLVCAQNGQMQGLWKIRKNGAKG